MSGCSTTTVILVAEVFYPIKAERGTLITERTPNPSNFKLSNSSNPDYPDYPDFFYISPSSRLHLFYLLPHLSRIKAVYKTYL